MDSELERLHQSVIFSQLSAADVELMAGAMPRRQVPARQTVFEQDRPGDSLFVLARGRVAVRCRRPGKRGLVVAEALPGTVFGEMACIDPAARSATIDVIDDAVIYELPRTTLMSLRNSAPALAATIVGGITRIITERLREIDELLQTRLPAHPRLAATPHDHGPEFAQHRSAVTQPLDPAHVELPNGFDAADLKLLQGAGRAWVVEAGALLCRQGELGRSCFVLLRGELEVLRSGEDGPILLAMLNPGTLTGQMALIDRAPRSASLRVRHKAVVIELARDDFERLMSAASPFALRFQEHLAVAGTRQLRAALKVLKASPDRAARKPRATQEAQVARAAEDERRTAARFLASLKEWSLGIDSEADVTYVDHDGELGEKEITFLAG